MNYQTQPVPSPKSPYPSRAEALQSGQLFDLAELGFELPRLPGGAMAWGITGRLLDRAARIPLARLRSTTREARVRDLMGRAERALRRVRELYGEAFAAALLHGFCMDFAAHLPERSADPQYAFVRLHCGPDEDGEIVVTLGEVEEF